MIRIFYIVSLAFGLGFCKSNPYSATFHKVSKKNPSIVLIGPIKIHASDQTLFLRPLIKETLFINLLENGYMVEVLENENYVLDHHLSDIKVNQADSFFTNRMIGEVLQNNSNADFLTKKQIQNLTKSINYKHYIQGLVVIKDKNDFEKNISEGSIYFHLYDENGNLTGILRNEFELNRKMNWEDVQKAISLVISEMEN
ncbi:hypothetical protein P3G55_13075 [Leptospira sp. 96542]|nr:hypothetical protein [Leptospira sp. 96542]